LPSFGQNHDAGRAIALKALADFLDRATGALTAGVPLSEQLSWAPKEESAKRYLDGTHGPDDLAMLEGEAEETGETLEELAQRVLAKADANRRAVSKLTGIRRKAEADIHASNNRDTAQSVLDTAKAQWYQFISQLGA